MSSARLSQWPLAFLLALLVVGVLPPAPAAPVAQAAPVPFALPLLEGPQVKTELGEGAPSGPATSFQGNSPALVNFSVWWWDTGAPTSALVVVDGIPNLMMRAAGDDGDDGNGTLYEAHIAATGLAVGDHSWYYSFQGPSGSKRLPAIGNFTKLRLDEAGKFLSLPLRTSAASLYTSYSGGTITLREVLQRAMNLTDPLMGSDWDAALGYTYSDANRFVISPGGLISEDREVFVTTNGMQRARFVDSGTFAINSQPAIKQVLVLHSLLLATGIFNATDLEIRTETLLVDNKSYPHPFLRVLLNDLSEGPSDGPVAGDNLIDLDVWGMGLTPAVLFGKHFGDDNDISNDAPWDGSVGWAPSVDPNALYVLWPYETPYNATSPDGTVEHFFIIGSLMSAETTTPVQLSLYWNDEPAVFDGLSSTQTAYLDLVYSWQIESSILGSIGPVWLTPLTAVNTYRVTLTVRDPFLLEDSTTVTFDVRSKTRIRNPISDMTISENGSNSIDLRVFFQDDDGFNTIQFGITTDPPAYLHAARIPASSYFLTVSGEPFWCGAGTVRINATDGISPPVSQTFNVTVLCVNDPPTVSGLPPNIVMDEDSTFWLSNMSSYATDPDPLDVLTWGFSGGTHVSAYYESANNSLAFTPEPNWNGVDRGSILVTDGTVAINTSVTITVNRVNDPPLQIRALPPCSILEDSANQTLLLNDYFDDPDNDTLSANVVALPGLDAGYFTVLREIWFHPIANFSGSAGYGVTVRDTSGAALVANATCVVAPVNDPPLVALVDPLGFATGVEGDKFTFVIQVLDSDSPSLVYAFELDGDSQGQGFLNSFEWQTGFLSAGSHSLNVSVTDGAGGSVSYHWSVLVSEKNRPPTVSITHTGNGTYRTGDVIIFTAQGSDPDGDNLTYTWSFGGLLQPRSGPEINISFTSEGEYIVRVTVNDGKVTASSIDTIHVFYIAPVEPPTNNTPQKPVTSNFLAGFEAVFVAGAVAAVAAAAIALRRRR